jgi:hypothetical protein
MTKAEQGIPKLPKLLSVPEKGRGEEALRVMRYPFGNGSFQDALVHLVHQLNEHPELEKGAMYHTISIGLQHYALRLGIPDSVVADFLLVAQELGVLRASGRGVGSKWEVCDKDYTVYFLTESGLERAVTNVMERHRRTAEIRVLTKNLERMKEYAEVLQQRLMPGLGVDVAPAKGLPQPPRLKSVSVVPVAPPDMPPAKLPYRVFVERAIKELREGDRKGIHVVYSNFNKAFRAYYHEDARAIVDQLVEEGFITKCCKWHSANRNTTLIT